MPVRTPLSLLVPKALRRGLAAWLRAASERFEVADPLAGRMAELRARFPDAPRAWLEFVARNTAGGTPMHVVLPPPADLAAAAPPSDGALPGQGSDSSPVMPPGANPAPPGPMPATARMAAPQAPLRAAMTSPDMASARPGAPRIGAKHQRPEFMAVPDPAPSVAPAWDQPRAMPRAVTFRGVSGGTGREFGQGAPAASARAAAAGPDRPPLVPLRFLPSAPAASPGPAFVGRREIRRQAEPAFDPPVADRGRLPAQPGGPWPFTRPAGLPAAGGPEFGRDLVGTAPRRTSFGEARAARPGNPERFPDPQFGPPPGGHGGWPALPAERRDGRQARATDAGRLSALSAAQEVL